MLLLFVCVELIQRMLTLMIALEKVEFPIDCFVITLIIMSDS